eukprot:GHVL01036434.1.p1 GENE.GHVL01036434.1~~GHVL01036434.1.p1  ORF type:complete len:139 (-),score=10.01 GHVL01036434.1:176-592(-)
MYNLEFCVKCDRTEYGDIVAVSGSTPELGSWDQLRPLLLHTTPATFPFWKSYKVRSSSPRIFYKYFIITKEGKSVWESFTGDRFVNAHKHVITEDYFGHIIPQLVDEHFPFKQSVDDVTPQASNLLLIHEVRYFIKYL